MQCQWVVRERGYVVAVAELFCSSADVVLACFEQCDVLVRSSALVLDMELMYSW